MNISSVSEVTHATTICVLAWERQTAEGSGKTTLGRKGNHVAQNTITYDSTKQSNQARSLSLQEQ
jgi:hypothetical protein